jgi:hypothetical protein
MQRTRLGKRMPSAKLRPQGYQNGAPVTAYMHLLKIDLRSYIRHLIFALTNRATTAYTDSANKFSPSLKVIKPKHLQAFAPPALWLFITHMQQPRPACPGGKMTDG